VTRREVSAALRSYKVNKARLNLLSDQDELTRLHSIVQRVAVWLDALTVKERAVVEHHDIDGRTWPELAAHYGMSSDGVRRIYAGALDKIIAMEG